MDSYSDASRWPMSTDCRAELRARGGRTPRRGRGAPRGRDGPGSRTGRCGRPGESTAAALTGPRRGSTQCQAWPAVRRSKRRSPGSHSSIVPSSTRTRRDGGPPPPCAGRAPGRARHTRVPMNRRAAIPVPHPTSSTVRGAGAMSALDQLGRILRADPVVALGIVAEGAGPAAVAVQRPVLSHDRSRIDAAQRVDVAAAGERGGAARRPTASAPRSNVIVDRDDESRILAARASRWRMARKKSGTLASKVATPPITRATRGLVTSLMYPSRVAPIGVLPRKAMALRDMTRPRMAGSARSCKVALLVAMKRDAGRAHRDQQDDGHQFRRGQRDRHDQCRRRSTPITASSRVEGLLRWAVNRPPTTAPAPMAARKVL